MSRHILRKPVPTAADWSILARHGITPDGLTVGGWLYLSGCTGLTALPEGLTVGGWLDLSGCTGLTALPEGLTVGGSLDLNGCTGLTALPDGLTVGGWLELNGCTGLTALPDGLTVGGSLDLRGTAITALYTDARNYRLDRAGDHYHAGCRRFTAAEALAHWGSSNYRKPARGAAFVAAVEAEEARRKAAS